MGRVLISILEWLLFEPPLGVTLVRYAVIMLALHAGVFKFIFKVSAPHKKWFFWVSWIWVAIAVYAALALLVAIIVMWHVKGMG